MFDLQAHILIYDQLLSLQVESIWPIDGGLLIERSVGSTSSTCNMGDQSSIEEGLPVMFSLLHPLDDMSPVVCRFPSTGKVMNTDIGDIVDGLK